MKIFLPGAGGKVRHILNFQELPEVERVIISDIHPWAYGNFVADESYLLPPFADPRFLDEFERLYAQTGFDVCLPIHDASVSLFSRNRERMDGMDFLLALNPQQTIDIASDKLATYRFFVEIGLPTPMLYTLNDFLQLKNPSYPYYLKPRYIHIRGTGEQLFMQLDDEADLDYGLRKIRGREADFVVQQFVSGTEINIDFFCDDAGKVLSIVPLQRLGMGTSRGITRGEIIEDDRFDRYVHLVADKMRLWAANQLQAFLQETGEFLFTEINCRFSGSSIFVKEAGVNFFDAAVRLIQQREISFPRKPSLLKMNCWESPFFYEQSPAKNL